MNRAGSSQTQAPCGVRPESKNGRRAPSQLLPPWPAAGCALGVRAYHVPLLTRPRSGQDATCLLRGAAKSLCLGELLSTFVRTCTLPPALYNGARPEPRVPRGHACSTAWLLCTWRRSSLGESAGLNGEHWVGICDPLELTVESETSADLMEDIALSCPGGSTGCGMQADALPAGALEPGHADARDLHRQGAGVRGRFRSARRPPKR